MLTKNRRDILKKRGSLEPRERAVYDYRLLQWLETMLDSGPEGGIGDINHVLDALDKEAIRKHLKDENVYDLLKLVDRLFDILEFLPVEQTTRGQAIVAKPIPFHGQSEKAVVRRANDSDYERNLRLYNFDQELKLHYSDPETVAQLKGFQEKESAKRLVQLGLKTPDQDSPDGWPNIDAINKHYNMANDPK